MRKKNNIIRRIILLSAAFVIVSLNCYSQVNNIYNLMPVPLTMQTLAKDRIKINEQFRVAITGKPNDRLYAEASRFVRRLSNKTGIFLDGQGFVTKQQNESTATLLIKVQRGGLLKIDEQEGYAIETTPKQIVVSAPTDLGAIHALETLLQLVSTDTAGYYFPAVSVKDQPRFAWRGLLLDVALHFMPVEVVKRTLDGMAAVKMNVLHLHLSNDQGFRVESKVFPRLQQVASDGIFYTQNDIRDIVKYAAQRGIRIVPEFVVPAHTTAILTAYPQFASVKRNYTLQRYFGVFDPVMDPTNEQLYPFLEKLFTEMSSLFPDAYFHIGGDENTGKDWEAVPHIKAFMQAHGMQTTMDLQTYFNQRLLPIVRKMGKIMMGWDEVLHPDLPKEIVIQSWRGNESFYSSVKKGYKAILSYGYYIDLIQPAAYHYANDPAPDSAALTANEEKMILGGEATMWSELVTPLTVDSRIWPRTAAIAERLWSPKNVTDVDDMYRRLDITSLGLESLGLQHLTAKQVLMRQLCNSYNTTALEVLTGILEPLKIYERNEKDSMYTVFSPFTKLADIAVPDQAVPRNFNKLVTRYLSGTTANNEKDIVDQLNIWKANDAAFKQLLSGAPGLAEAAPLSENLSLLAAAGLESVDYIRQQKKADEAWLKAKLKIANAARQQGGRCELQVVDAVQKLIENAAAKN